MQNSKKREGDGRRRDSATYRWIVDNASYEGNDCLIWPFGGKDTKGYGVFGRLGKMLLAHRVMCQIAWGDPPSPQHQASHECGNGHLGCVNPNHLRWKTRSENMLDKRKHGTSGNGGGNTDGGKLTPQQKSEIRALRGVVSVQELARRYGVKRGTIDRQHRILRYGYDPNDQRSRKSKTA